MFFEIQSAEYEQLPFLLTTIGTSDPQLPVDRPSGSRIHHFLYITHGAGQFGFPDGPRVLEAGKGVFFRAEMPISYRAFGKSFSTAWLTFRGSGADALLDYYGLGDYRIFDLADGMTEKLLLLERSAQRRTDVQRSADGYALALDILEHITRPASEWSQKVLRVNHCLESRFNEPLTLDELAREAGTDRFTLCQQYKRLTGATVMSRLRDIRIAKAQEMLLSGQVRIADVGRSCGFESASYFGKIFRQVTGFTPGTWRERFR